MSRETSTREADGVQRDVTNCLERLQQEKPDPAGVPQGSSGRTRRRSLDVVQLARRGSSSGRARRRSLDVVQLARRGSSSGRARWRSLDVVQFARRGRDDYINERVKTRTSHPSTYAIVCVLYCCLVSIRKIYKPLKNC